MACMCVYMRTLRKRERGWGEGIVVSTVVGKTLIYVRMYTERGREIWERFCECCGWFDFLDR
jgi:hypothetical protein